MVYRKINFGAKNQLSEKITVVQERQFYYDFLLQVIYYILEQ